MLDGLDDALRGRVKQIAAGRALLLCDRQLLVSRWNLAVTEIDTAVAEMVEAGLLVENGSVSSYDSEGVAHESPMWEPGDEEQPLRK